MSDKPIAFNEAELSQLQEIVQQNDSFNSWGQAISRSLHCGQDAVLVANLLNFLKNLIEQNAKNTEEIKAKAQSRIADEAAAKTEEKKAS